MNTKSSHILNSSSNLLGFSFFVLSTIKSMGVPQKSIIDETIALCILLLAASCFLSFLSIRTEGESRSEHFENYADAVFFVALFCIVCIALLLAFDVVALHVAP